MTNFKKYKNIAFFALILEIIASFILFAKIMNLIADNKIKSNESFIFTLIVIVLAIGGLLFILVFKLSSNNNIEDLNQDITFSEISDNTNSSSNENLTEQIDVENIIRKIIPKETSRFNIVDYTEKLLSNIAKEFDIVQGLFYLKEIDSDLYKPIGKYAYFGDEEPKEFKYGETLSGQVAKNKTILYLDEIPDNYVTILSGLGTSSPKNLIIIPVIFEENSIGIIELASFKEFEKRYNDLYLKMSELVGKTISAH